MITIQSAGRLGNKLNYFCVGMYLHDITGYKFIPEIIPGFINTYNIKNGVINNTQIKSSEYSYNEKYFFDELINQKKGIIVNTMVDRYFLFKKMNDYKINNIKQYLIIENENLYETPSKDELVIHIRLGDYKYYNWTIDKKLYMNVINLDRPSKVTIITDNLYDDFINDFRLIGCDIKSGNSIEDFIYLKNSKKLCISNSTFSWTAAYISDAEKIYWPISGNNPPYLSNPTKKDADMRPFDRNNYIYI